MSEVDKIGIVKTADVYDFDFITRSLGLIPICNSSRAINAGAITFIRPRGDETHTWVEIGIHGGESFTLSSEEMIELEATIKRRAAEGKELQKQAIKDNIQAQQEAVNELNRGVAAPILVGGPGKRKL